MKLMIFFPITISLFMCAFLSACSTSDIPVKARDNATLYQVNALEEFLLSDIPKWADFVSEGNCFRKQRINFLNMAKVSEKLSMTFEQAIQLQLTFNYQQSKLRVEKSSPFVSLDDQNFLFYNAQEQVMGGKNDFKSPAFKRVHLVFIDELLNDATNKQLELMLKKLLLDTDFHHGHPVLVSYCYDLLSMEKWLANSSLSQLDLDLKLISAELASHYNENFEALPRFDFQWNVLLKNKEIFHYQIKTAPRNGVRVSN